MKIIQEFDLCEVPETKSCLHKRVIWRIKQSRNYSRGEIDQQFTEFSEFTENRRYEQIAQRKRF